LEDIVERSRVREAHIIFLHIIWRLLKAISNPRDIVEVALLLFLQKTRLRVDGPIDGRVGLKGLDIPGVHDELASRLVVFRKGRDKEPHRQIEFVLLAHYELLVGLLGVFIDHEPVIQIDPYVLSVFDLQVELVVSFGGLGAVDDVGADIV
jgi:hypothetical protein